MSLAIDVDTVTAVLLADGWHDVIDDSFDVDAYEFEEKIAEGEDPRLLHGGEHSGISDSGFVCRTSQGMICGPLTSLLAVKVRTED
jgi:hypothetical protein